MYIKAANIYKTESEIVEFTTSYLGDTRKVEYTNSSTIGTEYWSDFVA